MFLVVQIKATAVGLGVFAGEPIAAGNLVCAYEGEVIDSEELLRRYPDMEPEYAFRAGDVYIDGANSSHWSRLMNHHQHGTLEFEVFEEPPKVEFRAARSIQVGEELTFDYGEEFWEGRSFKPINDDRVYSGPVECDLYDLGVPMSLEAMNDVLRAPAEDPQKKAALMRALDYFGVPQDQIPVPTWRRGPRLVSFQTASIRDLSRALRAKF